MRTSEERIKIGRDYQRLTETEAWKDLSKILNQVVTGAQEQWLNNDKVDDKIKVYALAYRRVLSIVENKIAIGKKAEAGVLGKEKSRPHKRKVIV